MRNGEKERKSRVNRQPSSIQENTSTGFFLFFSFKEKNCRKKLSKLVLNYIFNQTLKTLRNDN